MVGKMTKKTSAKMTDLEISDLYKGNSWRYNLSNKKQYPGRGGGVVQVLTGKAIMEQIVAGRLCFYRRPTPQVQLYTQGDWRQELNR